MCRLYGKVFHCNGIMRCGHQVIFGMRLRIHSLLPFSSVLLSLIIGLFFVFYGSRTFLARFFIMFYASLATPEIVLAVGLLSLFSFFSIPLGLTTLIAGHTLIGLGYVIPILHTRYQELDKRYMEAHLIWVQLKGRH